MAKMDDRSKLASITWPLNTIEQDHHEFPVPNPAQPITLQSAAMTNHLTAKDGGVTWDRVSNSSSSSSFYWHWKVSTDPWVIQNI